MYTPTLRMCKFTIPTTFYVATLFRVKSNSLWLSLSLPIPQIFSLRDSRAIGEDQAEEFGGGKSAGKRGGEGK